MHRIIGMKRQVLSILILLAIATPAMAARLVDRLLQSYDAIETVSCEVRRTSEIDGNKIRSLSRVHYQHPDRINVYSRVPIERRHVADGKRMYYYVEGDPKGFSRPIADLDKDWLISLRQVPGTPMKHLLEIGDAEEDELPPASDYPIRRGYATEKPYIVLCCDGKGRLAKVEYYQSADMKDRILKSEYKNFFEPIEDVWIARLHQSEFNMHGIAKTETVQFINMIVNEPIAKKLFDPAPYFKDVEFVDEFEKIYQR